MKIHFVMQDLRKFILENKNLYLYLLVSTYNSFFIVGTVNTYELKCFSLLSNIIILLNMFNKALSVILDEYYCVNFFDYIILLVRYIA
jgi:hypothetical protein